MKKFLAVLIAAMLMLTAFAGCSNEETVDGNAVAVTMGNQEYTVEDMNFMYITAFNEMYSYYGGYIDPTKPLEDQTAMEGISWHQYVLDYAINTLKTITGVYEKALETGFVLPEEYQSDIDSFDSQFESIATQAGMTVDEYIEMNYGGSVSLASLKKMTEIQLYCNAYIQDLHSNTTASAEEIAAFYEENKKDIDTVDFRYYSLFYGETEAAEGEEPEATLTKEEAETKANALSEAKTAEEFNALTLEFTTDEEQKKLFEESDATLFPGATYDSTGIEEVSEWLFDETRQQGDTMVYHDEAYSSYLVIMFEERIDPDYSLIDVRHILIAPEAGEDGKISDEAWTAAEEKATEIHNGYLAGEQSEDAFAALAVEHSSDGNAAQGGIYEDVPKGMMVKTFNDWCFDEARQPGDTGIVKTSYGYHIMYFVGEGGNNLTAVVEPAVVEEKLTAVLAECAKNITEEKTEDYDKVGGMIDDIINGMNGTDAETEEETKSYTGIIIAVLIAIIIVCIIIIIKNSKKAKTPEEETEVTEEADEPVLEATEDDLTEEELLAEEAFEEAAEEVAEEATEETEETEEAETEAEEAEDK